MLTRTREAIEAELGAGVEQIAHPYRTVAFWTPLSSPGDAEA